MAFNLFDFSQVPESSDPSGLRKSMNPFGSAREAFKPDARVHFATWARETYATGYDVNRTNPFSTTSTDITGGVNISEPQGIKPNPSETVNPNLSDRTAKLFPDEKDALSKMMADGKSEDESFNLLSQRRKDLLGNTKLTGIETSAIQKMIADGLPSEEAVKAIQAHREEMKTQAKTDSKNLPLGKKIAKGALDLAAGNFETLMKYGGNTLDFLTFWQAGIGEEVKEGERAAQSYKDATGVWAAYSVGSALPDVAMAVAPVGGALASGSAIAQWAKLGALYGGINPVLEKWSEAGIGDVATWAWIGAAGWAVIGGAITGVGKAASFVKNKLPESLIATGIGTPSKLLNASERLKKLGASEYSDATAASKWLLKNKIAGTLEERTAQIDSVIDAGTKASKSMLEKSKKTYSNEVTKDLQKWLSELLPSFAKVTKEGEIIAKAGNESVVSKINALTKNPKMTAQEINEARRFIADKGQIFRTSGDTANDAGKLGLQEVWKNASKFIEKEFPGFRAANKDVEVWIALKDAIALKQSQDQVRQLMTLSNVGASGIGALGGYGTEWDVWGALKWAAAWFAAKKAGELVFSPANMSKLALFLSSKYGKAEGARIANALAESSKKNVPLNTDIEKKVNDFIREKMAKKSVLGNIQRSTEKGTKISDLIK